MLNADRQVYVIAVFPVGIFRVFLVFFAMSFVLSLNDE